MELYRAKEYAIGETWLIGSVIRFPEKVYMLLTDFLNPDRPSYNGVCIGAGLEDQSITDRYLAAEYGWTEALGRYEENFPQWIQLEPETVTKFADKRDKKGIGLFEGDVIQIPHGVGYSRYEIRYGHYAAFDPVDEIFMDNVGFYMVSDEPHALYDGIQIPFPLGYTERNAEWIGNVFDNPELKMSANAASQDTGQDVLIPAT